MERYDLRTIFNSSEFFLYLEPIQVTYNNYVHNVHTTCIYLNNKIFTLD
jgi:hypothetical protein